MAFDTQTRNRLQSFVSKARKLLCGEYNKPSGEITSQLQRFGIQPDGTVADLDEVPNLSQLDYELGQTLRSVLEHKQGSEAAIEAWGYDPHVYDLIQEQGFTVLNRLCALRLAEERGILPHPVVSNGINSDGFQLYEMVVDKKQLSKEQRYQDFLFSIFDELSLDLGILFDRHSPQGMLFPEGEALNEFLELLNDPEIAHLWAEDETIGWIYQYWNSKDERKGMRDASAAPRNSRELAVRNQFFTPRYVVEFLTDNTLGRIWYEMTKGETRLAEQCRYLVRRRTEIFLGEDEDAPPEGDTEDLSAEASAKAETLSQEELLKQPVHISHRPVKDPREIRLLDPACGSMHFGLYAFNLFEVIYEEAWDKGHCPALQKAYPEKADYLCDVPRLIIEHNIHGVDIDPRAVQIAGLSLWLRAQKTWKDTPAAERPRVRRSNIVCAEPMPGSDAMLEDFVQTLNPPLLGELVRTVFDKMQLAGEAGTLLKIEEEIRTAIDDAKAKWEKLGTAERELFSAEELNQTLRPGTQQELTGVEKALTTDHRPLATDFFDTAEERIYAALRDYAESAEAGDYQRRLFAEDAAHGFAFIDLCRKRYDAVVMNPPFGDLSEAFFDYGTTEYALTKYDLGTIFIERAIHLSESTGRCGWITSRTWMALSLLEEFRREILYESGRLAAVADFGIGVLDALVETAACIVSIGGQPHDSALTLRLLASKNKGEDFTAAITNRGAQGHWIDLSLMRKLPRAAFGYWLPRSFIENLDHLASLESSGGIARQGLATTDDYRFFRLIWEVPATRVGFSNRWVPLAKGGEYEPYYDDIHLVIDYENDGLVLKTHLVVNKGQKHWSRRIASSEYYGREGLTYPERTTSDFSPRPLPRGSIFTATGQSIFLESTTDALAYLGLSYSRIFKLLLELFVGGGDASESGSAARDYTSGILNEMPLPELSPSLSAVADMTASAIELRRKHFRQDEVTMDFVVAPLAQSCESLPLTQLLDERFTDYQSDSVELLEIAESIDHECAGAFGVSSESLLDEEVCPLPTEYPESDDALFIPAGGVKELIAETCQSRGFRRAFTKKAYWANRVLELKWHSVARRAEIAESHELASTSRHLRSPIPDLVSYLMGALLGRWDIRYATGERQPPELPAPFDPLPVCPPGMLQNAEGLPAAQSDVPDDYPLPITWPGILVSDPGHPEDIVARVRDALAVIWGDRSAAIEQEACQILGVRTLRDYFAEKKSGGKFFKDHLKRYSKSRRQAPIYWPLSTESGSYTLWIYYHRLSDDTLFTCITQFVEKKQEQLEGTRDKLAAKPKRSDEEDQEYEAAESLLAELTTLQAELERLAKIWKPNLNDGVQITAAPLWNLFRLPVWRNKLKKTWEEMEAGKYDWAHLSHSLWPERVIPKCVEDRSLAIAHGYQDELWVEVKVTKGKKTKLEWQPKKNADKIVKKLIEKQTGQ